ncbi:MAG: sugar transferase [bacterium]
MSELYELLTLKVAVKTITPEWFIYDLTRIHRPIYRLCKRIFDIIGASIISFVTLPIMIILAVSTKIADGGKIFYTQERVGKNGKIFEMLKFRTMIENAEKDGAVWAVNNNKDTRVTKIGRIARKLRFDELPQMLNIIKGEMSLVGPRPERPEFTQILEKKIPFYQRRHWVTPGWTGWAQIMYRYGASTEDAIEKLRYELYYIKHRNLFWDFSILVKAVFMALSGRHG